MFETLVHFEVDNYLAIPANLSILKGSERGGS